MATNSSEDELPVFESLPPPQESPRGVLLNLSAALSEHAKKLERMARKRPRLDGTEPMTPKHTSSGSSKLKKAIDVKGELLALTEILCKTALPLYIDILARANVMQKALKRGSGSSDPVPPKSDNIVVSEYILVDGPKGSYVWATGTG